MKAFEQLRSLPPISGLRRFIGACWAYSHVRIGYINDNARVVQSTYGRLKEFGLGEACLALCHSLKGQFSIFVAMNDDESIRIYYNWTESEFNPTRLHGERTTYVDYGKLSEQEIIEELGKLIIPEDLPEGSQDIFASIRAYYLGLPQPERVPKITEPTYSLWISVEHGRKMILQAARRWRMYAIHREAWLMFLAMIVESAVDCGSDVACSFITGSNLASDMDLRLDEEIAQKWALRAIELIDKHASTPQPKP